MGARPAPTTGQRVREVFAGAGFRRYFAARAASQLGDGIFQLAAADILVFKNPGANPALKLAAITALTLIPFSAIGPFTGVFIDRWDRRRILTVTPVIRAVLAALVPVIAVNDLVLGLFVLVVLSANRFFLSTMGAILPQLVPAGDLLVANSVSSTGGSIANVIGLGAGSGLSKLLGGPETGLVAAAAFVGAAGLARLVKVHRGHPSTRAPLGAEIREVLAEMVEGVRMVRGAPRVVYALASVTSVQLLVGAMTSAVTFYFIGTLGLDVDSAFTLLGSLAAGIGAGVVVVPFAARIAGQDRLIPIAYVVGGLAVLGTGSHLTRSTVVAGAFFAGVSYALAKIPVDTIVQEEMPDAFRGRAFAVYDMLFNIARVVGITAAAFSLSSVRGAAPIVVGIALGYLVLAAVFATWERRLAARGADASGGVSSRPMRFRKRSGPAGPAPEALLRPGEMVVVRSYSGARADEEPRAIVVGDTEIPVEQVDWRGIEERGGERRRFFVVRAGGLRVRLALLEGEDRWEVERILPNRKTQ